MCLFVFRTVASSLSELGETAMCTSDNTDMTDVDMASIAENELCEKFSVQGTSTRSSGGVKKVVSIIIHLFVCVWVYVHEIFFFFQCYLRLWRILNF